MNIYVYIVTLLAVTRLRHSKQLISITKTAHATEEF
jgi:hypothetical protein